jgi:hypothetical protein
MSVPSSDIYTYERALDEYGLPVGPERKVRRKKRLEHKMKAKTQPQKKRADAAWVAEWCGAGTWTPYVPTSEAQLKNEEFNRESARLKKKDEAYAWEQWKQKQYLDGVCPCYYHNWCSPILCIFSTAWDKEPNKNSAAWFNNGKCDRTLYD